MTDQPSDPSIEMSNLELDNDLNAVSMEDFIFGTLATDELRLQQVVETRRGLAHERRNQPRDPLPGQPVTIEVTAGSDISAASVEVHFSVNGGESQMLPLTKGAPIWDTLLWSYVDTFSGTLPYQPEGAQARYQISATTLGGETIWAKETYSYNVDSYQVPTWARDAVIYHVFVDRFADSQGKQLADRDNLGELFGGTLNGVLHKLDYLEELGINTLWLSPIFPSPSHHGYDATDFREVNPRLGTKDDLKRLVDELHRREMRLILDFVPNHTSDEHPFFQSAQRDQKSPYADYYSFSNWPEEYETFFNVKTLPQINNEHPAARRYVIDSAAYWLQEFGVDGFRLDYAYGPSHDFWTDYYRIVKRENPDSFHFGEIVETPALLRSYEGVMDGALDFLWIQAVRKLFAFNSSDVAQFEQFLSRHEGYFAGVNFTLPTFLDNHDMNRFMWAARGDIRKLKQAAVCQFTLSAPPILYYGTEVGMSQRKDARQIGLEASRLPMIWDQQKQNFDLQQFYRDLTALRRNSTAIRRGSRTPLIVEPETGRYGYLRSDGREKVLVLFNVSAPARRFELPAGSWMEAFGGSSYSSSIEIGAYGYWVGIMADPAASANISV